MKKISFIVFTSFLMLTLSSCAIKAGFSTSVLVPAARGYVKVEVDDNKDYVIRIHLSDLVESSRLHPSKRTYVVWMVTDQYTTKNIGQVFCSASDFPYKLKSTFVAVSPFKPAKIFITAENDASIKYPGVQVVLSTNRF